MDLEIGRGVWEGRLGLGSSGEGNVVAGHITGGRGREREIRWGARREETDCLGKETETGSRGGGSQKGETRTGWGRRLR